MVGDNCDSKDDNALFCFLDLSPPTWAFQINLIQPSSITLKTKTVDIVAYQHSVHLCLATRSVTQSACVILTDSVVRLDDLPVKPDLNDGGDPPV
ncbi:hypothetical protein J6590_049381 [Homalodisca vitripennis]|nr:hypothetical protein J6590_049381 [Homalodisca vitripennis]